MGSSRCTSRRPCLAACECGPVSREPRRGGLTHQPPNFPAHLPRQSTSHRAIDQQAPRPLQLPVRTRLAQVLVRWRARADARACSERVRPIRANEHKSCSYNSRICPVDTCTYCTRHLRACARLAATARHVGAAPVAIFLTAARVAPIASGLTAAGWTNATSRLLT